MEGYSLQKHFTFALAYAWANAWAYARASLQKREEFCQKWEWHPIRWVCPSKEMPGHLPRQNGEWIFFAWACVSGFARANTQANAQANMEGYGAESLPVYGAEYGAESLPVFFHIKPGPETEPGQKNWDTNWAQNWDLSNLAFCPS